MKTLRKQALQLLLTRDPEAKAQGTMKLDLAEQVGAEEVIAEPADIPGRPLLPELVPPTQLKTRSVRNPEGHAALIHALAHIELNAIDLALDLAFRFHGMPDEFYLDWLNVAKEEALHFTLLRNHLVHLGHDYGHFPAHNSLWEMAEKTKHDILARIALVPRTMEARGLDASPPIKAKLLTIEDQKGAEIIDLILRDEIGHVAVGNKWYRVLCTERGRDPLTTYAALASAFSAPRLKGPFNLEARRAAGFDEDELYALEQLWTSKAN
ncbi:ferritin-like domain-containing protein [Aquabacterium sp.]|uniref:ferritin-like domain-containing protein n=1 Tax=Aquabacterium sp. TaxID=1872578 RepID=UPI00248A73FF|nr:ferritin-like domain-containing protein [Aquabacterium sp.]MDI1260759.1 ferritin-like domain-containing protein [Aquabacterium sp.]